MAETQNITTDKLLALLVAQLQKPQTPSPSLSRKDAAELLGVPESTIDNLHRSHELRAMRIGRHNVWSRADVMQYIESKRQFATVAADQQKTRQP